MNYSYYTLTKEFLDVVTFFKQKMKEFDLPKISFEFSGSRYIIEAPEKEEERIKVIQRIIKNK